MTIKTSHTKNTQVQNQTKDSLSSKPRIAVFHAFLKNKGGAERFALDLCIRYNADLYVGGVRSDLFFPENDDPFSQAIFKQIPHFYSLHEDGRRVGWLHIKRQLFFLFSPIVKQLREYDIVIFTGNVSWVANRVAWKNTKTKIISYCHTPPRIFADQKEEKIANRSFVFKAVYNLFAYIVLAVYRWGLQASDIIIANSYNIQNRLKTYTGLDSIPIFPMVQTRRFVYQKEGDYFISYCRLEDMKRIKLIVEAFKHRPNQKLIVCSSGPLKEWLIETITREKLNNIEYKGLVSDAELEELVGCCRAGIYIPVDEDAGITQCEIMAAGKPVLGVAEGGLLETVIHEKTGYLIPKNPTCDDVLVGIDWMVDADTLAMRDDCVTQAQLFDESVFFDKMNQIISTLLDTDTYDHKQIKK